MISRLRILCRMPPMLLHLPRGCSWICSAASWAPPESCPWWPSPVNKETSCKNYLSSYLSALERIIELLDKIQNRISASYSPLCDTLLQTSLENQRSSDQHSPPTRCDASPLSLLLYVAARCMHASRAKIINWSILNVQPKNALALVVMNLQMNSCIWDVNE